MYKINQITSDAKQTQTLILPQDGTVLTLRLYFSDIQKGWFINELSYLTVTGQFTLKTLRITNSYNLLHQFKNKLPFGLHCSSKNQREPSLQQDFSSGNSTLYLLTSAEVAAFAKYISG